MDNTVFSGELVKNLGPVGEFEKNVRQANGDLLKEGNFSNVPSVDVLKKIGAKYDEKYSFDEDMFKKMRRFRLLTHGLADISKNVICKSFKMLINNLRATSIFIQNTVTNRRA